LRLPADLLGPALRQAIFGRT